MKTKEIVLVLFTVALGVALISLLSYWFGESHVLDRWAKSLETAAAEPIGEPLILTLPDPVTVPAFIVTYEEKQLLDELVKERKAKQAEFAPQQPFPQPKASAYFQTSDAAVKDGTVTLKRSD